MNLGGSLRISCAEDGGAVITADTARLLRIVVVSSLPDRLPAAMGDAASGRIFTAAFDPATLRHRYCAAGNRHAVSYTGNLIDGQARVRRANGGAFETIFACGGAACGVSGPDVSGYLSGNGLLTALSLGHLAGASGIGIRQSN